MAFNQINRQFGKGSIMRLGEGPGLEAISAISTGAVSLDAALGCGGVPRGRIVEIFGPESSGKTTIALQIIAEVQRRGGMAAFVDAEHALDPIYAKALGVQTDNLIVSQPDTGEQALEIAEILTSSGSLDVIVIDSVAALVPKAELEGDMGGSPCGPSGATHEPGPSQAHGRGAPQQCLFHLHQPDSHEDWRDVRQSGGPPPVETR